LPAKIHPASLGASTFGTGPSQHARIELSRRAYFDYRACDALSVVNLGIFFRHVGKRVHATSFSRSTEANRPSPFSFDC